MNHAVTVPQLFPPSPKVAHASKGDSQSPRPCLTQKELGRHRATFKDVQNTLATIQSRQEAQRVMMNLTRIQPFLSAMLAYTEMAQVSYDASNCIAVIWGSLKRMFEVASSFPKAFDDLLEAYEQLGEAIPSLEQKQWVFEVHPQLLKILELIYSDLLDFHERGLAIFDRTDWRQLYSASWEDWKPRFRSILQNLSQQKGLIELFASQITNPLERNAVLNFNVKYVAGNVFEHIDVTNSQAHIGDTYHGDTASCEFFQNSNSAISEQLKSLQHLLSGTRSLINQQELRKHEDQLATVRDWISGIRVTRFHERAYQTHLESIGTGSWILEDDRLQHWLYEDLPRKPMLWMHGIPGAGKTILASVIVETCKHVPDSSTVYFYCQHDDDRTCTSIGILQGLLSQAIDQRPDLTPYFDEQRQHGGGPVLELERLARRLMEVVCHGSNRRYIVIDGLDECTSYNRSQVLSFFADLMQDVDSKAPGKNRLLVVSQNEPDIKRALVRAQDFELRQEHNRSDIEHFVTRWARKIRDKFGLNNEQEDHIKTKTCLQAAGQFLYAALVVKNLHAQPSVYDLISEIQDSRFPKELAEAYERIISRIRQNTGDKEWDLTKRVLGWMTCAARPLRWYEMQGAISISLDRNEATPSFNHDRRLRNHVQNTCGALVMVLDDRICLVHGTARQFIAESKHIDAPKVECEMATLCIQYLSFACFSPTKTKEELHYFILNGYFAFADYAVAKWTHHMHRFLGLAKILAAEDQWSDREIAVQELCEAAQYFTEDYADDLQAIPAIPGTGDLNFRISSQARDLLSKFEDAEQYFELLWAHLVSHRRRDAKARNVISLEQLRQEIDKFRTALEHMAILTNTAVSAEDRARLEAYYGAKPFRCSKLMCFYFHEGFFDRKSRDRHVARHDRPWQCTEPDCTSADLGFDSKQTLDRHVLSFHPDMEMKASLFETPAPEPVVSKWSCGICGKNFARNSILKDHQLVHSGQKPHECSRCGKAFTRKNDCVRHEKIHEKR